MYLEVMHTYHSHIRCGAFPERTADDAGASQRGPLAPLLLISSMYKATAISCHSYVSKAQRMHGMSGCIALLEDAVRSAAVLRMQPRF